MNIPPKCNVQDICETPRVHAIAPVLFSSERETRWGFCVAWCCGIAVEGGMVGHAGDGESCRMTHKHTHTSR